MDLEGIMVSEISHSPEDKYRMVSFMWESGEVMLPEIEGRMVVARG
jgi:hypothetical protein